MKFSLVSALFASLLILPRLALALPATAEIDITLPDPLPAVGEEFSVDVRVDTGGNSVGGVGVYLDFSDSLSFVSADESSSVFDQEVLPAEADGKTVGFTRLRFDEGFNGTDGLLASLTFERVTDGTVSIIVNKDKTELIAFADSSNLLKKSGSVVAVAGGKDDEEGEDKDGSEEEEGQSLWQGFVRWISNLWPF